MRGRQVAVALVVSFGVACGGGGPDEQASDRTVIDRSDEVAMPPSANAPRASLPARSPDTVRPDTAAMAGAPGDAPEAVAPPGRRRSPEELDLGAIISTYREYYREEYFEQGSDVRGGVDPDLVEDAKRRVALDWGYVIVGAWESLVADLTRDQRVVLSNRLEAANEVLARELHGPDAPGPR